MSLPTTIEELCDLHEADVYYTFNDFIGVPVSTTLTHWYLKTDAGFELTGTTPEPHGEQHPITQEEESMIRRRNAPISAAEARVLRSILIKHGYRANPGARPGENDISTVKIKRRKNPGRKVRMFGPGKRWATKAAMKRYMAKIRRLANKRARKVRRKTRKTKGSRMRRRSRK